MKKIRLAICICVDKFLKVRVLSLVRRSFFYLFYGVDLGENVIIQPGLRIFRFAKIEVGRDSYFGHGVSLEVGREWERCKGLLIGSRVWLSQGCLIQCMGEISIGTDVMIGEFTSIRDTTHGADRLDVPMKQQSDVVGRIYVGNNVWIGRGCLILGSPEGVRLGDGSIVGANSVVTRSIPSNEIWGGVPARFIRARKISDKAS